MEPLPADIAAHVRHRLAEMRMAELALQQSMSQTPRYLDQFSAAARLIAGVVDLTAPGRSASERFDRVADELNRGGPIGNSNTLDRHHIRRAVARYNSDLLKVVNLAASRNSIVPVDLLLKAEIIGLRGTTASGEGAPPLAPISGCRSGSKNWSARRLRDEVRPRARGGRLANGGVGAVRSSA